VIQKADAELLTLERRPHELVVGVVSSDRRKGRSPGTIA
jgi:hypothetical protein